MSISVLNNKNNTEGCCFIRPFKFRSGHSVPLYDIKSTGAFNQLVGFAKFLNSEYGNVYYRGVSGLYDNVLPSLMRSRAKGIPFDLTDIINRIMQDERLKESLKLRSKVIPKSDSDHRLNRQIDRFNKYTVEALLQHYVGSTRFLDIVDNHWIALWMGLHKFNLHGNGNRYCDCIYRHLPLGDAYEYMLTTSKSYSNQDIYVYILLIAMPHEDNHSQYGITETECFVEVDLRKALPSIYLRPHAQHALAVRKRDKQNKEQVADYYDMSSQVVGILRIRIDHAGQWLGHGMLMTKDNIFPSPSIDQGYNTLLLRTDIFKNPFEILKYY